MSAFTESVARFVEKASDAIQDVLLAENAVKKPAFSARGGQCVLSSTAFTCPMRCPKHCQRPVRRHAPGRALRSIPRAPVHLASHYTRAEKLGRTESAGDHPEALRQQAWARPAPG